LKNVTSSLAGQRASGYYIERSLLILSNNRDMMKGEKHASLRETSL